MFISPYNPLILSYNPVVYPMVVFTPFYPFYERFYWGRRRRGRGRWFGWSRWYFPNRWNWNPWLYWNY